MHYAGGDVPASSFTLSLHNPDLAFRPKALSMNTKTVVTINSNGRQSASFIRVASAIGWTVRGHIHKKAGIVADELDSLPGVTLLEGRLEDKKFVDDLFKGAQIAFINTTHWGDEVTIGKSLANAAKKAGIQHYVYSSMPDHSIYDDQWTPLPMWADKFTVENYIRQIGIPATFVYCGIYHNNFTSLNFPLFRMELQDNGSFVWRAPFYPNHPLPWLDSEHDVGPAVLQIFKLGPRKLGGDRYVIMIAFLALYEVQQVCRDGDTILTRHALPIMAPCLVRGTRICNVHTLTLIHRIPLAFAHLTPREVCRAFSRGLGRPVRYEQGPISIEVPVPTGYRQHLQALQETLGRHRAPYFGPDLEPDCPGRAIDLWEGFRDMEEYAREVFPTEEAANGLTWMEEGDEPQPEVDVDYRGQTSC